MKQIIIFLLLVITSLIGYGIYTDYKRYNLPDVNYETDKNIDTSYHNKELLYNYYEAIKNLESYIMMQWSANEIDLRTPEDDDIETKNALETYAKKLAKVNYYEAILENSFLLKDKGLTNDEIKFIEEKGIDIATYKRKLKNDKIKILFNPDKNIYNGSKNTIIYEVQKELNNRGHKIQMDGIYRVETLNAIKKFEEKHHLFADGLLDELTIEMMFE
jgi:hypothetical protein